MCLYVDPVNFVPGAPKRALDGICSLGRKVRKVTSFHWRVDQRGRFLSAETRITFAKQEFWATIRRHNGMLRLDVADGAGIQADLPTEESFETAVGMANKILEAWGFEPVKEG
jgi:hypothetical protein